MADRPLLPRALREILLPYFKPTRSALWPGGWRAFLRQHAVAFEVWFRGRVAWFMLTQRWRRWRGQETLNWDDEQQIDVTVRHNYRHRWLFSRPRTEKLMTVLHCVGAIAPDAKVLVVGPRNEAEILLLACYGFRLGNITGVDLFTYSPRIRAMDMHKMEFGDDAFDVVFVSWVLKYAYDLPRACRELVRVVRPGGIIAAGYTQTVSTSAIVGKGAELAGGLAELHEKFAPHVDHVYWQEADPAGDGNHRVTSIFRVRK